MGKRHIPHKKRIELVEAYAESGLNIKEYAVLNGIGYSTLQRWLSNRKAALKTTDAYPSNTIAMQASEQRLIANRFCQPHDRPDSPVHFMDITSHISRAMPPVDVEEDAYRQENSDSISNTPASAHTVAQKSVRTKSSAPHNQLDILLPNGIRMTFHQTSLDMSIALIKSLV
jgi:transposase-like protein